MNTSAVCIAICVCVMRRENEKGSEYYMQRRSCVTRDDKNLTGQRMCRLFK